MLSSLKLSLEIQDVYVLFRIQFSQWRISIGIIEKTEIPKRLKSLKSFQIESTDRIGLTIELI